MSTLTRAPAAPEASGASEHRSARGRFTGSWGVALRMARRDVRRHKGRSALILVMVALPTLLLVFAITSAATSQVTGPEQIPSRMGSGVAALDYPVPNAVDQPFDPSVGMSSTGEVAPIPGWVEGGSSFDNAQAISTLTGTTAVPFLEESATTRVDDRRISLQTMAVDARTGLDGKVILRSGRLPQRAGEVLVTEVGVDRGLPTSGPLTLRTGGTEHEVTVVGTARVLSGGGGTYHHLVTPTPFTSGQAGGGWILVGDDPVTWSDVRDLNRHGLLVWSADVLRDPPDVSALSAEQRDMLVFDQDRTGTFVAIGGALLLVITTLLVGPAFAVSAARQRRTLALSASNGATTAQLRHTVLAQALVLGAIAAVTGAALGVLTTWALARQRRAAEWLGLVGPFEVPVVPILLVTATAVASAIIAALLPARRLGRLDIVGVMKGQSVSPRPSKVVFLVGALLAGLGGFAVISLAASQARAQTGGGEVPIVLATIALVVGAVMLAPMTLVGLARVSSRLPVSLRMATRDAGRQRTRSVPAIAAILAGVAVLTMVLIASGSDEEQRRREYVAQNLPGDTSVHAGSETLDAERVERITAGFRAVRPGLVVSPVSAVDTNDPWMTSSTPPTQPFDLRVLNVVPPGCAPEETFGSAAPTDAAEQAGPPPCMLIGTQGMGNAQMSFTNADEITRRLTAIGRESDVAAVLAGAVVIGHAPGSTRVVIDGRVTVMTATQHVDPRENAEVDPAGALDDVRTTTLPAVEVELTKETMGALLSSSLLATTATAKAHGWPTRTSFLTVHDPAGPISQDLSDRLGYGADDDVYLMTERGFVSEYGTIIAVLLGIFTLLLLVITLTSTALTLTEQENDQATLAALGSGRGTRRVMAAAQAFTLCVIGAVLGVAVGIVPGIALAYPLTAQGWNPLTGQSVIGDPVLVFPWPVLLGFAVAVPAVAAGLAAAGIRKAPDATRRTA
ncbi:FtsX-like permease family protein [Knoellia flava]|uniref:Lipoprotein release ABC transporter permease n=2 Tax=Knoellia flava TaxID=913969 RepID=A0A8H9KU61_9MICO|nr:FtsX-like permease family protein [Knoellia flava]GGB79127.1 lipoprotein release ABC transporter permease [Knoellia flava]